MMNSAIVCEGSTDYVLLQYYMRKVYLWNDGGCGEFRISNQRSRLLRRNEDKLTILSTGGCSRLAEGLEVVLDRNYYDEPSHRNTIKKIVIITDHDDKDTPERFLNSLAGRILNKGGGLNGPLQVNRWQQFDFQDSYGARINISLLPMVLPSDEEGAMETFLLDSLCATDAYEMELIKQCREFVDNVDKEKRYLNHRRIVTKAKFDTYFSVRTAADQFTQSCLKCTNFAL